MLEINVHFDLPKYTSLLQVGHLGILYSDLLSSRWTICWELHNKRANSLAVWDPKGIPGD